MKYFEIEGRLPSLNDYINKCRTNKYLAAKFKSDTEEIIGVFIKKAKLGQITKPCEIHITWVEPNRKRDVDNIQSAQKYILDALVKEGILKNDTQKWVRQITHKILVDEEPRILVVFKEIEDDIID